ncbi:hypothetical protein AWN76_000700 [Rhodothermaceae bacterium RA]|nr:hypothetical protein AWN76_000700 [Rhodothermaceae bacterium RA]
MPASLIARSSEGARFLLLQTRGHFLFVLALWAVLYLLGLGYHLFVWSTGALASPVLEVVYNAIVLFDYALLWLLIASLVERHRAAPTKAFWQTVLIGLLLLGIGLLIARVGRVTNIVDNPTIDLLGFEYETGVPLTPVTVLKMNLLSLMQVGFAFLLLARFRHLVLFKRTRRSQRNWYAMLALMIVTSLTTFTMTAAEEGIGEWRIPTVIVLVPAVLLMVVNAFRLSWIVFLSFRQKLALIGLTLLLLVMLAAGQVLGHGFFLIDATDYLYHYSYPLAVFTEQAFVFSILYGTTALLSLLFHLPTTGDFQQKVGEMAAIQSLTNLVSKVFDSEQLVSTIVASPVEAGSAQMAWLALTDLQSGSLRPRVVATHGVDPARLDALVDTGALYEDLGTRSGPLVLDEAPADHRVGARPGEGLGSLVGLPLVARDEMLGALFIAKEVTHGFEQEDLGALTAFAAQAALALDNARLFEEQLEKERLTRELDIARAVQRKLLPQQVPALDGVTLAASSVSAQEVGGDYYDFARLDADRLAFIVADVSGKGTSAAFYMAEMQGIFHAISHLARTPREFLTHANRALAASLERNVFISVIYGILDVRREELVLARAGHCPAAVIHLDGEARYLRTQGLGLGLDRSDLFARTLAEERLTLQPGDVFVLYTDGVVESRNARGEEYGYDRLLEALRRHRHEDAPDLHRALLTDLHHFLGHDAYDDDMTLMVLKWHGIRLSTPETTLQHQPEKPEDEPAMVPEKP